MSRAASMSGRALAIVQRRLGERHLDTEIARRTPGSTRWNGLQDQHR